MYILHLALKIRHGMLLGLAEINNAVDDEPLFISPSTVAASAAISWHSTTPTRTPTSSPSSSRASSPKCRRVIQLAIGITSGNRARVGRVGEDPREDVRVGVVEFQLYAKPMA